MRPVIGIIMCGSENKRQFISQSYVTAIERSGGIPVLIPNMTGFKTFSKYTEICNGFLFCGGGDITPLLFDEDPLPGIGDTDIETDISQIAFMEYVLYNDRPVLGICRGMQVLNAALGGTIYQDMSTRPHPSLEHMQHSVNRSDISHKVAFKKNSLLYEICGNSCYTNTYHHQCIHCPGESLIITGMTSDGIAESIESVLHSYAVGVQWHPECMYRTSPQMRKLFHSFVLSCGISI